MLTRQLVQTSWICLHFLAADTLYSSVAHRLRIVGPLISEDALAAIASLRVPNTHLPSPPGRRIPDATPVPPPPRRYCVYRIYTTLLFRRPEDYAREAVHRGSYAT
ncbi:hypothetical protein K439DRAFT_1621443 [Ramaria rubella]|nr:hypothetical protein K439DRAFT_1621443 [Ramaria rubella]